MSELLQGVFLSGTRERMLAIARRLVRERAIQGLILGGTEIPLLLREDTLEGIPILNTTKIHVERAVERLLA